MRRRTFPDSLVLILGIVVLAQIATYVLPAGEFERVGRAVVPGTYRVLEPDPAAPSGALAFLKTVPAFLVAIPKGMAGAADIIFLVFIVGGAIGIVRATGAIDALIGGTLARFGNRPILLIGGATTLFALGASTIGMAEGYLPFIPILVTMCIALRMDALVALGMVYGGAAIGFGAAATNPFTVVIGQSIAGLPTLSGQGLRWILFAVCVAVGIHHLLRYARRVQADPSQSLVGHVDYSDGFDPPEERPFTRGRIAVLATFVLGIAVFVWGSKARGWYVSELSTIFLAVGCLAAVFGRLSPNRAAAVFKEGAAQMTTTALLVGFARAIQVVLDDGKVTDTVIHAVATPLEQAGATTAAIGMLGVQGVCNLFIPSGSGQAYVTMPIMAPLADLVGVTRQTAVLAYQMGDGFTNMIIPTNYVLMGMLSLGRIPYPSWVRFVGPLLLKLLVVCVVTLVIAVQIGYE